MKRVAIYARVSTTDQTCDNQLNDLRAYCRARGWDTVTEYVDQGISGTKEKRPALDKLLGAVFTIIAAIAQLERSLITERVKAGLRRARAEGKRLGRPPVRLDPIAVERVMRRNLSVRAAAKELGISASSYLRVLRARQGAPVPSEAVAG